MFYTTNNPPQSYSSSLWVISTSAIIPLSLFTLLSENTIIIQWDITPLGFTTVSLPFILDHISTTFSLTVIFISANVIHFSSSYINGDPFITRFTHLVIIFVLSINLLIFIPHIICLLIGWDGLGITSFVLVIYYQNPNSLAAGIITALTNRIGDVIILLSIAWTLNQGQWNILNIWTTQNLPQIPLIIIIAAITKSAQIPFSSWLPAAIAAPTPVSALVHSSTLVTAGVFLTIRFYPSLHQTDFFNPAILIISSLTIVRHIPPTRNTI